MRVDDDAGAGTTVEIASRLVHSSALGFLVLRVGDLQTETTLLDPLAKSVLQFLRLLIPDNDLRSVTLRTLSELDAHWSGYHGTTSHVLLIGHGSPDSITFVGDGAISGEQLAARLQGLAPTAAPKTFILTCVPHGSRGIRETV